jgi:hypothetical protein
VIDGSRVKNVVLTKKEEWREMEKCTTKELQSNLKVVLNKTLIQNWEQ